LVGTIGNLGRHVPGTLRCGAHRAAQISRRSRRAGAGRAIALHGGMLGTLYLIALVITVVGCAAKPLTRHSVIRVAIRERDTFVDAAPTLDR
jgi:hypothetical protein